MNHDDDEDLHFASPCGWPFTILCTLVASVLALAGLAVKGMF